MAKIIKAEIFTNEKIATDIYKMTLKSEYIAQSAMPGQFVNVKCSEGLNALLRRPISICTVDRINSTFDIIYQIKGIGTQYLSQKNTEGIVDIIAPLGNLFDINEDFKRIAVVGGGIGIFPLLFLLEQKRNAVRASFLGFRSKEFIVLEDKFKSSSEALFICTEDGSAGHKGLVTEPLESELKQNKYDIIYACGPTPMVKRVSQIAKENSVKCQVSLEQRMGCGIGACLVCACKIRLGDEWEYSHVCKDGPIFWSEEVLFE